MQCPYCQAYDTKVVDSRLSEQNEVRRRRECISCNERFTTYETVELSLPRLIKRDGSCVQFREEKLRAGILRALEKRQVRSEQVDAAVRRIIMQLRATGEGEVETSILGEWVMAELRALDEVAYVRFASVYRRFQDVNEFRDEIAKLKNDTLGNDALDILKQTKKNIPNADERSMEMSTTTTTTTETAKAMKMDDNQNQFRMHENEFVMNKEISEPHE